ncbi:DUF4249 domain-containing protein [Dyadobacter psychrotolerans]|uniref:DUF4249 domain-containing protein n=1 Tax=Dyadobacter psychrotolerans TaxID=2541721 RepID=A0A4R5E0S1_9BACT|nr:DUF4249 domain-containing protein [Dyadobacter psychrotolerans]TDE18674.1 DUF4249 domain-containing protein [Dyadobacter psychrotolerans]
MKLIHCLLLCFAVMLSACESLVTVVSQDKLPDTEAKLVVQAFLNPQAARTTVIVTESAPLFGTSPDRGNVIKNAIVKLSDGTKEVTLSFDSAGASYGIDKARFAIVAGKTYSLSVSDGQRSIQATCVVPAKQVIVKSFVIDTIFSNNGFLIDTSLTVKMSWQDIAGEANYYRLRAYLELEYTHGEGNSVETFRERRVRNRFNVDWDRTIGRNDYQSDANLDGAILTSPLGTFELPETITYDFGTGKKFVVRPKNKIVSITFDLYNADEAYFKYHRSLQLRNNENPFSEPSLIFTNINGGLGCFSAYNIGTRIYKP